MTSYGHSFIKIIWLIRIFFPILKIEQFWNLIKHAVFNQTRMEICYCSKFWFYPQKTGNNWRKKIRFILKLFLIVHFIFFFHLTFDPREPKIEAKSKWWSKQYCFMLLVLSGVARWTLLMMYQYKYSGQQYFSFSTILYLVDFYLTRTYHIHFRNGIQTFYLNIHSNRNRWTCQEKTLS